jgi:hypothetical protein
MHWGLIRADGSEKPAFIALKRLIDELNDTAEPHARMQLSWSLSTADPAVHHLLLQKSDGELDLVLWQEISSYDFRNQKEIVNPPLQTQLTLGSRASSVTLYEPAVQAGPLKSFVNTTTVPLAIPDHPLVIAIKLN